MPVLGIFRLAEMLDWSRSTTHRYVITLVALGCLEQATRRQYRLTLKLARLGLEAMNGTGLSEHARPILQELVRRTQFTVCLAVLDGPVTQYVDRLPGRRSGRTRSLDALMRAPLAAHTTALGKLLLVYLPRAVQREVLCELTLTKPGPSTITSKWRLRQELRGIREAGIATADEELIAHLGAIAAPVRSHEGEVVAAVALSADRSVIGVDMLVDALSPHLIATADQVSARLGFRHGHEPAHLLNGHYRMAFDGEGA